MYKTLDILRALNKDTKAEVYLVGGFVRDLLRKKRNDDLDVVIRKASLKTITSYLERYGKVIRVSLKKTTDKFSVSILLFKATGDHIEAQIALPRRGERQIADPNNTLRQDHAYRDFTINALYLPVDYKTSKDVIDISGGRQDIKNRIIKTNGDPTKRIKESPIRMMRAMSLAARTGYKLDKTLAAAIHKNLTLLEKVPIEGIRIELNKILLSKTPSKYLKLMRRIGLLKKILPELDRCYKVNQDERYHKYDVFCHCIYAADNIDPNIILRLAALLHDIGKVDTREILSNKKDPKARRITFHKHEMHSVKLAKKALTRLRYDKQTINEVIALIRHHMYHYTRDYTDAAVRRFIKKVGITKEHLQDLGSFPLFKLRAAERLGNGLKTVPVTEKQKDFEARITKILKENSGLHIKDLAVDGNDLIKILKIKQSPKIGKILNTLLEHVLEHPKHNDRVYLLGLAAIHVDNSSKQKSPAV